MSLKLGTLNFVGQDTIGVGVQLHSKLPSRHPQGPDRSDDLGPLHILPLFDPSKNRLTQQYYARPLKHEHVDYDLIRKWLDLCRSFHGQRCSEPSYFRLEKPRNFRVIDIETRSVVEAPSGCQYATLSYVWGGPQLVASANDLARLPWFLPSPSALSETINDSITVASQLGIRYLWVDALCIVQTPTVNGDKSAQVSQMDRIYGSAVLCIMAAGSESALTGIPGVEHRRSNQLNQKTCDVGGLELTLCQPSLPEDVDSLPWNKRGWTYQERLLSNRALIIGQNQAWWVCQCDVWCESIVAETPVNELGEPMVARPPVDSSRPPERPYTVGLDAYTTYDRKDEKNLLKGYLTLVSLYSQRQLGRPADGMNAVAGVFNVLAKSYSQFFSHLHHGLPDICFDFALLWSTHFDWQRPKSWDGQQKLPSWTWTGWFGGNDGYVEWNESLHWSGRPSVWSAVAWHVVDEHGHSQRIARVTNQITHQHDSDASKSQTPCGLTDETTLDMPPTVPLDQLEEGGGYYLHFLSTTTRSFHVGKQRQWDGKHDDQRSFATQPFELCTGDGAAVGTISLVPENGTELQEHGRTVELVFLSYTNSFEFTPRWANVMASDAKTPGMWPVVNAMWIRRVANGIVERIQIARVTSKAWLAAERTTEWILLG
ncbi:hypothetical protein LTR17_022856 [Elasticomyces elasticus]|nr:hypothetical protein LTR17_022856 [Elasticomyces elasticus]